MASGRITIPVGLETGDVKKGAKDAEKALSNLEDAVGDAGKGGAKDLGKIEDELKDVQKQSKKTGTAVGSDMSEGFQKAGEGADNFKEEANQTARESAASFDGSAQSITDAFQEVAANAFSGFGPAGAIAGIAAAAGIGLLTKSFEDAEEHRKQLEERANDLAQAYIDAGSTVLGALDVASRTADILGDPDQKKNAKELAAALGTDLATAVRILAGDTNALAVANGVVKDSEQEYRDLMLKRGSDYKSLTEDEKKRGDQLQRQRDLMREVNGVTADATTTFETQQEILKGLINSADTATKEVDDLGNALYTLPDGEQILIEADTGNATTDLAKFKGDAVKATETLTQKVKVEVDSRAWDDWIPPAKKGTIRGTILSPNGLNQPI